MHAREGWERACPGDIRARGACVPRGHACPPQRPDTMRYGRSMSGQYASYWNAFLLNLVTKFFAENDVQTWDVLVLLNFSYCSSESRETGSLGATEYRV